MWLVLPSVTVITKKDKKLLQNVTVITKCDAARLSEVAFKTFNNGT